MTAETPVVDPKLCHVSAEQTNIVSSGQNPAPRRQCGRSTADEVLSGGDLDEPRPGRGSGVGMEGGVAAGRGGGGEGGRAEGRG